MDIYKELGIRKVINASGTMTHLGGSISDPKVMDAMKEASQSFVIMMELMEKAGEVVANVTGAEAGMVTAGASAAMVLGAAACIMRWSELENYEVEPVERLNLDGDWREIIQRLPDTSWTHDEFIIQKNHRNAYDHAYIVAGGKLVTVGTDEGCSVNEFEDAINEKTAGIAFTARVKEKGLPLKKVVEIAHRHDIPIVVDAAAELPPRENLKRFISEDADLVIFSGGKKISGPNDTGILCGKKDLIKLAMLQAPPYRGIGRGMKVDRTQIVGFLTALKLWINKDEDAEFNSWKEKATWIADSLRNNPQISTSEAIIDIKKRTAYARISLENNTNVKADEMVYQLRNEDPSIWINYMGYNEIGIEPSLLRDGEEKTVVESIKKHL